MEKTVNSKLLHEGRHFSFKRDEVQLSNGKHTFREIVEHPGAVAIIPIINDSLILVRQYRYAAKESLLELPAGTLEKNEDPMSCAERELQEETGYTAKCWKRLYSCYMAPGYSNEIIHFFSAKGLVKVGVNPEYDEEICVEIHSFDKVVQMIKVNKIRDAKTISGVLFYLTKINS